MGKATVRRGVLLAGAGVLLVAAVAIRLSRAPGERHAFHPPALSAGSEHPEPLLRLPSELPRDAARPAVVAAGERKTGGHIRVRRPDGTYEVVEETVELYSRLTTGLMMKTVARFEAVQADLRDRFTQALKDGGAAAAWQLLTPLLRTPRPDNDDKARVYEALRLAVEVQRSLGGGGPQGPYESIRGAASDAIVAFLGSPEVHSFTKGVALEYLANRTMTAAAAGPGAVEIDGLLAYDPEAVWEAFVMPESRPTSPLKPGEDPNPALRNPALLDACLRLVRGEGEDTNVRGQALRALGTKKETLQGLDLLALARASDAELGKVAVELLGASPGALPGGAFFSLLKAHDDPRWKTVVFEKLSAEAFTSPEMTQVLIRDLPSQPRSTEEYGEATYSNSVLQATLEQYFVRKDRGLFDLLVKALPTWAGYEWPFEGSPVVSVAEHAARHQLKEFASPLRALLPQLTSPEDRKSVQAALAALEK